jgi:hypothetical protein
MKFRYAPDTVQGGGGTRTELRSACFGSSADDSLMDISTLNRRFLRQKPDYMAMPANRPFSRHISVSKYEYKLRRDMWAGSGSSFSAAVSHFAIEESGHTNGATVG